jgi:hypothetical protein
MQLGLGLGLRGFMLLEAGLWSKRVSKGGMRGLKAVTIVFWLIQPIENNDPTINKKESTNERKDINNLRARSRSDSFAFTKVLLLATFLFLSCSSVLTCMQSVCARVWSLRRFCYKFDFSLGLLLRLWLRLVLGLRLGYHRRLPYGIMSKLTPYNIQPVNTVRIPLLSAITRSMARDRD